MQSNIQAKRGMASRYKDAQRSGESSQLVRFMRRGPRAPSQSASFVHQRAGQCKAHDRGGSGARTESVRANWESKSRSRSTSKATDRRVRFTRASLCSAGSRGGCLCMSCGAASNSRFLAHLWRASEWQGFGMRRAAGAEARIYSECLTRRLSAALPRCCMGSWILVGLFWRLKAAGGGARSTFARTFWNQSRNQCQRQRQRTGVSVPHGQKQ